MSDILRVTDPGWYNFHKSILNDEVIFWTPGITMPGKIMIGEFIFFYVKSKPRFIGGYGVLKEQNTESLSKLWDTYKYKLGYNTLDELLSAMNEKTGSYGELSRNSSIGYYYLEKVKFFENAIRPKHTYQIQKEKKKTWIDDFGIFQFDFDIVWGKPLSKDNVEWLLEKIESTPKAVTASNRNQDQKNKAEIEKIAINKTIQNLQKGGWTVTSVEKDNVGYDLLARKKSITLYIEVKGLSGELTTVELTPNEYTTLKRNQDKYIVAIVFSCSTENPILTYFRYKNSIKKWVNKTNHYIEFYERTGATLKIA